ncbi:MAG: efflux RND transporter periplasmic adaptor subunit [Candidatus Auribacterota bacterium]
MLIRRVLRKSWKPGLILLIVLVLINRVYFAPIPVQEYVVKKGTITAEVMGTGTLEARVKATISAKISGLLLDVLVDQGDRVVKGQILAKLDDGDLKEQVEVARSELLATKAGVDRAEAEITVAKATAVNARNLYSRKVALAEEKIASEEDLDNATQQRDVAEAQLRRAELAKVEIELQVSTAENSLRYYQEKLADTQIYAPFDGLIIQRNLDPGTIVVPGSSILQIISTDQVWVSAWIDETVMDSLAIGQSARVVFRSEPDKSYQGTVARISPLADRETRELIVDVLVKELPKMWAVGQRAEVYIETAHKDNVLLVPQSVIVWQKGKPGLFINNTGRAKWIDVKLGLRGSESVEILSGMNEGDIVFRPCDKTKTQLTESRLVKIQ